MSDQPLEPRLLPQARQTDGLLRFAHDAMACTFQILIAGHDPSAARGASAAVFDEIDRLEQELSRFVPSSDVGRINALAAGDSVRVGIEVIDCLELAARVSAETGGAFDVAFRGQTSLRAPEQTQLHVDRQARTVFASADSVEVDLGGVGKGYAVDQAANLLREWNIDAALIHAGQSTLLALGHAADGRDWRIAIRDPRDHAKSLGVVRLADGALSGSGVALHGQHIIDPRSGAPAGGALGAWALAPDAAWSDALSTAFMILGDDEIEAYCANHKTVGAIVLSEGTEGVQRTFGAVVLEHSPPNRSAGRGWEGEAPAEPS